MHDDQKIDEVTEKYAQRVKDLDVARPLELLFEYWNRAPQTDAASRYYRRLTAVDFEVRIEKAEKPWVSDYLPLIKERWDHRHEVIDGLNEALFSSDGDAPSLELTFGNYGLRKLLGFGGFGAAFLAVNGNVPQGDEFTLKVHHPGDNLAAAQLDREFATLTSLHCDRAVDRFPKPVAEGRCGELTARYVVLSHMPGISLSRWVALNKPDEAARLRAAWQLADRFNSLHLREVYQGDTSPENVLVHDNGGEPIISLIDFGSGGVQAGSFYHAHALSAFTTHFAAPSLVSGEARAGRDTDLWGMATMIYFILTKGGHPFGPATASTDEWLEHTRRTRVNCPPAIDSSIWEKLVMCFKHKDSSRGESVTAEMVRNAIPLSPISTRAINVLNSNNVAIDEHKRHRLKQRYLNQVRESFGKVKVPVATPEDGGYGVDHSSVPIGDLIVDLPLIVVGDPVTQHDESRQSGVGFARKIEKEKAREKVEKERPRSVACRLGDRLKEGVKATVLIGQPGCGKSTMFAWVAHQYATRELQGAPKREAKPVEDYQPFLPDRHLVPVVIVCREILKALQSGAPELPVLLDHQLRHALYTEDERQELIDVLMSHINDGTGLLMIDGLDEVHPQPRRRELASIIATAARRGGCQILLTCRVIGYEAIRDELNEFETVMVEQLDPGTVKDYVRRWAALSGGRLNVDSMLDQLQQPDVQALTETALMLALLTQVVAVGKEIPREKSDALKRICQVMIASRGGDLEARENVFYPLLERLAYSMRIGGEAGEGVQRLSEDDVLRSFQATRIAEPNNRGIQKRLPDKLLRHLVDRTGLLTYAGWGHDSRTGINFRIVQFAHQLIQEYFAARAIVHGRTPSGLRASEQIAAMLAEPVPGGKDNLPYFAHPLKELGHGKHVEPVIAERWQEVIPMALGVMSDSVDADAATHAILPRSDMSPDESRARAVLAVRCLAGSRRLSSTVAAKLVDVAVENLWHIDAALDSDNHRSQMELAFSRVAKLGRYDFVKDRLIEIILASSGDHRDSMLTILSRLIDDGAENTSLFWKDDADIPPYIQSLLTRLREHIESQREPEAIELSIWLLGIFYRARVRGRLQIIAACEGNVRSAILDLVESTQSRLVQALLMWAFTWLIGTRYDTPEPAKPLTHSEKERILQLLEDPDADELLTCRCAELLAPTWRAILFQQFVGNDWIYHCAVVADGARPASELQMAFKEWRAKVDTIFPGPAIEKRIVPALKRAFFAASSQIARRRIAVSLARLGEFQPDFADPLRDHFAQDFGMIDREREEAVFYLYCIGTPAVTRMLMEASRKTIDDFFSSRGFVVNALLASAEQCAEWLPEASDDMINAVAYFLAGSPDADKAVLLDKLETHPHERVRKAIAAARTRVKEWVEKPRVAFELKVQPIPFAS